MSNLNTATAYYQAMDCKNFEEMASYLHSCVRFIGPLSTMDDKAAIVEAAKNFSVFFKSLTIQGKFEAGDQVMLVLAFECPEPVGHFRGASLLSFADGLISRIELFYDARPFVQKRDEIFK